MTDAQHDQVILEQRRRTRELLALYYTVAADAETGGVDIGQIQPVTGIWIFGLLATAIIGGLMRPQCAIAIRPYAIFPNSIGPRATT